MDRTLKFSRATVEWSFRLSTYTAYSITASRYTLLRLQIRISPANFTSLS